MRRRLLPRLLVVSGGHCIARSGTARWNEVSKRRCRSTIGASRSRTTIATAAATVSVDKVNRVFTSLGGVRFLLEVGDALHETTLGWNTGSASVASTTAGRGSRTSAATGVVATGIAATRVVVVFGLEESAERQLASATLPGESNSRDADFFVFDFPTMLFYVDHFSFAHASGATTASTSGLTCGCATATGWCTRLSLIHI